MRYMVTKTAEEDYVRLSCEICHGKLNAEEIRRRLSKIGEEYPIDKAIDELKERNNHNGLFKGWGPIELGYLLSKYERHLAQEAGQNPTNEQWERIWKTSFERVQT